MPASPFLMPSVAHRAQGKVKNLNPFSTKKSGSMSGGMKYIPGTHVLGALTYSLSETDASNVLNQTVPDVEKYGEPVCVELKAGEASVHSDLLLHGSDANESTRRRCGLTLRYTSGDVRAYMTWEEKGVIVAGKKPDHWSNRPRPGEE